MSAVTTSRDAQGTLNPGVVIGALASILILSLVLPYWAVSTLHARRLQRADRDLAALAASLAHAQSLPAGEVLLGKGDRPRAIDPAWSTAPAAPLPESAIGTDPWGNAYIALVGADGRPAVVLSAGPDGILQTSAANGAQPSGDDRASRVPR